MSHEVEHPFIGHLEEILDLHGNQISVESCYYGQILLGMARKIRVWHNPWWLLMLLKLCIRVPLCILLRRFILWLHL